MKERRIYDFDCRKCLSLTGMGRIWHPAFKVTLPSTEGVSLSIPFQARLLETGKENKVSWHVFPVALLVGLEGYASPVYLSCTITPLPRRSRNREVHGLYLILLLR